MELISKTLSPVWELLVNSIVLEDKTTRQHPAPEISSLLVVTTHRTGRLNPPLWTLKSFIVTTFPK